MSIVSVAECDDTDVRLVGGETPDDGWVEMCLEEKWGSLCVSNWDIREARVICRQLGYNGCRLNIENFSDNLCFFSDSISSTYSYYTIKCIFGISPLKCLLLWN